MSDCSQGRAVKEVPHWFLKELLFNYINMKDTDVRAHVSVQIFTVIIVQIVDFRVEHFYNLCF
jgi:hypothetical protein